MRMLEIKHKRHTAPDDVLPLDLETAPDHPARAFGFRAYVGGVLYIEGLVVLLMGITLLASYWPPIDAYDTPANPAGKLGMWLSIIAMVYMIVVGVCIFCYNLWRPGSGISKSRHIEPRIANRVRRYASMKRRTRYIFDNTIQCEDDAEEAIRARDMY